MNKCLVCGSASINYISGLFDDRYGAKGIHSIYRCIKCGFGRTSPGLKPSLIPKFYQKYYPLSSLTASEVLNSAQIPSKITSWLNGTNNIAHRKIDAGDTVLDIGSASGVSLLEINKIGGKAHGVEPDPNAQEIAKELGLNVYQGLVTDNPFGNKKFDKITASQVFEHEPDPDKFLDSVHKKLTSTGTLIMSFPNIDALYAKLFKRRWLHWHIPYHYNFFTKKSLYILAKKHGFKIVSIKTVTPNLWTVLQFQTLQYKPVEGKMSSLWARQHAAHRLEKQKNFQTKALSTLVSILGILGKYIFIFPNRALDLLGLGESFVIEMKKN